MGEIEIKAIVGKLPEIALVLQGADPGDKPEVFRQLGVKLIYHPARRIAKAEMRAPDWYFDSDRGET